MKILHLLYESDGDYFGIGGVGIRAYEIYDHLNGRHDITLLCKKYPGARDGQKRGLRHTFAGVESRSLMKTLLAYAYHAAQYVRKNGDQYAVIIEEFSPAIPTFLHAVTQRPVILQVQGHTGTLYFRKYNPIYAAALCAMESLRPRFYDNFIFMNEETGRKFSIPYPPPYLAGTDGAISSSGGRKRVAIIPNGVSGELLDAQPEEGDYILYLGRVDIYGKGLDILVEGYRDFVKSFPEIRLAVAGDGRDMQGFKALLMELPEDIRKKVDLPGWISGDEKTEVMRKALFAVCPSRHEVQPLAVLEAMACGKAVIVSDIPEFRFIPEKGAGISFQMGNASSLANSMRELMRSVDRNEMGERGRQWVRDYTWGRIAGKYEAFLNEVSGSGTDLRINSP